MTKVRQLNEDALSEWLADRPQVIRDMVESHPPDRLYRMSDTGQRVTIASYAEDRTVRVEVTGDYNLVFFPRLVFGVPIDTLTECELPGPDEPLGAMTEEPTEELLEDIRRSLGIKQESKP